MFRLIKYLVSYWFLKSNAPFFSGRRKYNNNFDNLGLTPSWWYVVICRLFVLYFKINIFLFFLTNKIFYHQHYVVKFILLCNLKYYFPTRLALNMILWRNPIFMNLYQFIKIFSWNMCVDSYNIFIEFDFMSNEARLMKKVYRIHFYESS